MLLTSPTALMREPQVIGMADNELDLGDSPATDNVRVYDESFQEGVVVTLHVGLSRAQPCHRLTSHP